MMAANKESAICLTAQAGHEMFLAVTSGSFGERARSRPALGGSCFFRLSALSRSYKKGA